MKTCSNIHCHNYDESASHPCEDCRRKIAEHVTDMIADRASIERMKQWEKHKDTTKHPKKDE